MILGNLICFGLNSFFNTEGEAGKFFKKKVFLKTKLSKKKQIKC